MANIRGSANHSGVFAGARGWVANVLSALEVVAAGYVRVLAANTTDAHRILTSMRGTDGRSMRASSAAFNARIVSAWVTIIAVHGGEYAVAVCEIARVSSAHESVTAGLVREVASGSRITNTKLAKISCSARDRRSRTSIYCVSARERSGAFVVSIACNGGGEASGSGVTRVIFAGVSSSAGNRSKLAIASGLNTSIGGAF